MHGQLATFLVDVGAAVVAALICWAAALGVKMARSVRDSAAATATLTRAIADMNVELGAHRAQIAALQRAITPLGSLQSDPYLPPWDGRL